MYKQNSLLEKMRNVLSVDPYKASFADVETKIVRLSEKDRHWMLMLCKQIFEDTALRKDEVNRVATAKVIVALIPDSLKYIKYLLTTMSGENMYEIHFSLFCFLDNVQKLSGKGKPTQEVLGAIEEYLRNVKVETSYAAFMAGDLLGDHWEKEEAAPILLKLAKDARFVAGRLSAIHGLGHVLDKLRGNNPLKSRIVSAIETISMDDRSQEVREFASMITRGSNV